MKEYPKRFGIWLTASLLRLLLSLRYQRFKLLFAFMLKERIVSTSTRLFIPSSKTSNLFQLKVAKLLKT